MTDSPPFHILQIPVNLPPFIYLKPRNVIPFNWTLPVSVRHYRVKLHLLLPFAGERVVISVLVPIGIGKKNARDAKVVAREHLGSRWK